MITNNKNQKYVKNIQLFVSVLCFVGLLSSTTLWQDGDWKAPAEAKELKNPKPGEKSSIKSGAKLYNQFCVACHGKNGTGDGPGAKALNPKPADHTSKKVQDQTDGEIYWKIYNGRGMMTPWGTSKILKEDQIWDLVNYVRTLDASKK